MLELTGFNPGFDDENVLQEFAGSRLDWGLGDSSVEAEEFGDGMRVPVASFLYPPTPYDGADYQ